jgi:hypothetical protein
MPRCCVCTHDREGGETFTLTEEEKAAIGPSAEDEVYYCKPCLKVMQSREGGAQLLRGVYEMRLREIGVARSEVLAEQLYNKLTKDSEH